MLEAIVALLAAILIILCMILLKPHRTKIFALFNSGNGVDLSIRNVLWSRNAMITDVGQLSYFDGKSTACPYAVTGIIPELEAHRGKYVDIIIAERMEQP